jgi:hypothetical protein
MAIRVITKPHENINEYSLFETQNSTSQALYSADFHGGAFSHRAWITGQSFATNNGGGEAVPHRAYPILDFSSNPFKTPCQITLWVKLDIVLNFKTPPEPDDWFSFMTLAADPLWQRVVTINLRRESNSYFVFLQHVPNFGESSHIYQASISNSGLAFPMLQWVELKVQYDAINSRGHCKVFQDGVLVSHAQVNNGNGAMHMFHAGMYASAAIGTPGGGNFYSVLNDDLEIRDAYLFPRILNFSSVNHCGF